MSLEIYNQIRLKYHVQVVLLQDYTFKHHFMSLCFQYCNGGDLAEYLNCKCALFHLTQKSFDKMCILYSCLNFRGTHMEDIL